MRRFALSVGGVVALACVSFALAVEPTGYVIPKGLPPLKLPEGNEYSAAKIELGKQLYFDPRLSSNDKVSCASCHDPAKGWSNGEAVATGVGEKHGNRSSPTIINSAYSQLQFWDGRAKELEGQALGPIQNPIEMNMTLEAVCKKLNAIPGYKQQFQKVFGTDVNPEGIAKAIAAFERTVLSGDAPVDRYEAGDKKALSEAAERGYKLFHGKANCVACHTGHSLSDFAFHNLGIGSALDLPDMGRHEVTKMDGDRMSFKTPTLREIARTAPYMHDGSLKTLEEVVDYYNQGGTANEYLDEEIFALKLTDGEKSDLVTFLKEGFVSPSYPLVAPPKLP